MFNKSFESVACEAAHQWHSKWRQVRIHPPQLCESFKAMKRESSALGCNWVILSLSDVITENWPPRLGEGGGGLDARLTSIAAKCKEAKS
jgi:hypothetical protein